MFRVSLKLAVIEAKAITPLFNPKSPHLLFDEAYLVLIALIRVELQHNFVELVG